MHVGVSPTTLSSTTWPLKLTQLYGILPLDSPPLLLKGICEMALCVLHTLILRYFDSIFQHKICRPWTELIKWNIGKEGRNWIANKSCLSISSYIAFSSTIAERPGELLFEQDSWHLLEYNTLTRLPLPFWFCSYLANFFYFYSPSPLSTNCFHLIRLCPVRQ